MKNISHSGGNMVRCENLEQALRAMRGRVVALNGLTADSTVLAGMGDLFAKSLATLTGTDDGSVAKRKEMRLLIERARNKDAAAVVELNELRVTNVDNFVRATSQFASLFFKSVPLGANDQAVFEHSYKQEVGIRYIGEDGGVRTTKATKASKRVPIDLKTLVSDDVEYPIRDINQGTDVNAAAKATVEIGFDLANKVDVDAKTLYDSLIGAFVTTGNKLNRTFITSSRVYTGNLPTTNLLTLADNTNVSKFRLAVPKAILRYCESFGKLFGGPIRPTGTILVASSDATDLADEINPLSAVSNALTDGILNDYSRFSYMNVNWTIVPDETLTPGICYPVLNRPVGEFYTKPEFDQDETEQVKKKNYETRYQTKVIQFAAPEPWRPFACRLHYRS